MKKIIYLALLISSVLTSCYTAEKALLQGNYDDAINLAIKKVRKNKATEKTVLTLESAYKKANDVDNDRIAYLKKEGRPSNFDEIYKLYNNMKVRQEKLRPLPSLFVHKPVQRKAKFDYVNYDDDLLVSKQKAAEYYYSCGKTELQNGDRYSARSAYKNFLETQKYYADYKELPTLMNEALTKGQTHVLLKVLNKTNSMLPPGFEKELLQMGVRELDMPWIKFDNELQSSKTYHYYILLTLKGINVMPDQLKENRYSETKQVQDGYAYVLDSKGNVKKDSLGNDVKTIKYKTITCNVLETSQHKEASIGGSLDYIDVATQQVLKSEPIAYVSNFNNFFAGAQGDINALKPETKNKLQGAFVPFPNNENMVLRANADLKNMAKNIVWNNKNFLQ
jgi:hypothetical protein